jgi:hypothetical protein
MQLVVQQSVLALQESPAAPHTLGLESHIPLAPHMLEQQSPLPAHAVPNTPHVGAASGPPLPFL